MPLFILRRSDLLMLPLQTCRMLEKHRLQRHLVHTLVSERNLHIHSFRPSFVTASAKTFSALTFPEIQDLHDPYPFVGGAALAWSYVPTLFLCGGSPFRRSWFLVPPFLVVLFASSSFFGVVVLSPPLSFLGGAAAALPFFLLWGVATSPHPSVPGGAVFFLLFG